MEVFYSKIIDYKTLKLGHFIIFSYMSKSQTGFFIPLKIVQKQKIYNKLYYGR